MHEMIQNSRIARFAKTFSLSVAVVATSVGWGAVASSQIVNSDAFNERAGHSILEGADEVLPTETEAARPSSVPLTKIDQDDTAYDAPVAPRPRMTSVKPLPTNSETSGGDSSGTVASSNPSIESANRRNLAQNKVSQLQPSHGVNSLRGSRLRPAPEDQPQQASSSSVGSFSSQTSQTSNKSSGFASSNTIANSGANSTASIYSQTSDLDQREAQSAEPKYESAYLHDQNLHRNPPVADKVSSTAKTQKLAAPVRMSASLVEDDFDTKESNHVQQTAYLSPAAPANPQFQTGGYRQSTNQQNNQQFGQRDQRRSAQRGQRNQSTQQTSQNQRTRQRNLPRQNQSQNQQQTQAQTTDSNSAKQALAKFSFDANQQLANGLPIRMLDFLKKSEGRASRSQLIPQYWEVYYDWAQSVSAKHHLDWVSSINSGQRNDASSVEIAKSNAQNEITHTAIQLGKSQAKMKSLTGNAQPIVPMDNPTVTRVKTNYQAFKSRGMIAPKFEGIDSTLKQMYELIASRANTLTMAEKNANEAQQLYSRNQSTVDHVLSAGRTWRTAESDFIASVVEYNKAYADYALALPYGRGPVDTVVNMLIVKPTNNQNVSNQAANGRPNLSNNASSNTVSQSNTSGNDYSIPYSGNQSNRQGGRSAQSRQARQSNSTNGNGGNIRPASNYAGPRPDGPSDTGQASETGNQMQYARQQTSPGPDTQPATGFNTVSQPATGRTNGDLITERSSAGTNLIKRPSQFPTQQPAAAASPFSSAAGSNQSVAPNQPTPPAQKSFQTRPSTQSPVGDRTATRPSPFTPAGSTDGAAAAPATTPKPPTNSTGFSFGG